MKLTATRDAALVEAGVEPDSVEEPEAAAEPVAAEPVAEALPLAAPGVGAPKLVTPDGRGPGATEAEAPTPSRKPTPCPEGPVTSLAFAWKTWKVLLPTPAALIAPTIPCSQWGEGASCLQ